MIDSILKRLKEAKEPCHGIFWFVRDEESAPFDILYLDIPQSQEFLGNSRNGLTYTHEKTWDDMKIRKSKFIQSKEWNYFPRGRVDIRNNRATVYLNPNINTSEYQDEIIKAFNLSRIPVRFISDGSTHYYSYLDR